MFQEENQRDADVCEIFIFRQQCLRFLQKRLQLQSENLLK